VAAALSSPRCGHLFERNATMSGNWIAGAVKGGKGNLHRALHVPQGDIIPESKINKASHADNPKLAKEARLAKTLEHLHRRHGGEV
jgi:hypothetical protein